MKRESMTVDDLAALGRAVQSLEHPSLAARIKSMVGRPIELIETVIPVSASLLVSKAVTAGLQTTLKIALRSMQSIPKPGSDMLHRALVTASGAAGGAFGLATLPVELPVSTIIIPVAKVKIFRSRKRLSPAFKFLR
jgi:hypothetical protein